MIALVLAEGEVIAESVIFCLYLCGITCLVIGLESSRTLIFSKGCLRFFPFKHGDYISTPMELIDLIKAVIRKYKPAIVVPTGSASVSFLSSYKDYITIPAFPVPSPDIFKILNDKWEFSQLLTKIGLPQPETFLLEGPTSFKITELPLSLVSKQPCGSSGEDIYYFNSKDSLLNFLKSCEKKLFPMIIQEYIPGYDIDLSILSIDGQIMAWSIQRLKGKGIIQFINEPDILSLGQRLIQEIKYSGVAHFDLRYDERDRSFKFIECNPRFWGTLKASCCCGVNFPCIGLKHELQLVPDSLLNKHMQQDTFWMTFSGLLKSFKSRDVFSNMKADTIRHGLKELSQMWFLIHEVSKHFPKASNKLVSFYDKWVKKIDDQLI